ncbi:MAG: zf-HC2 domain-containing protein [Phycisphaerae bacterium]|nr:zf-HC2 domain-containing protein [Phycisphaerae bacterium]
MSDCPSREQLAEYEAGRLPDSTAERLETHLKSCPTCRETFASLRAADRDSRTFRELFRGHSALLSGEDAATSDALADPNDRQAPSRSVSARDGGATSAWPIPDYERVALCGEGAYGSVWAVRDRIGVYRALKRIDLDRLARLGARCRERDALEIYCNRIARHPNLINIYHVGLVGSTFYYTMELADDQESHMSARRHLPPGYRPMTLATAMTDRLLRPDVAIEITRRLLRGLSRLHRNGLVHRDIKPSNIVFVDRQPKLADIGMVTILDREARPLGTPRYMPPDQATDMSADTFAIGRLLFEMLGGEDLEDIRELPRALELESSLWNLDEVMRIVKRACADSASQRYGDASAMLDDLEACGQVPFETMFREWERMEATAPRSTRLEAIELGRATLRALPWIFGILALLTLLYMLRLTLHLT